MGKIKISVRVDERMLEHIMREFGVSRTEAVEIALRRLSR